MNNNACAFRILLFVLANTLSGCIKESNRVYFTINPNDRKILLPVVLNDSITANMVFDSGANGRFMLDSSWIADHSYSAPNTLPDTFSGGSAWSYDRHLSLGYKNILLTVKIGNIDQTYNSLSIMNCKRAFQDNRMDGLFNIPDNDTSHIWELNFEYNYLEIHPVEKFKMPEKCILCPLLKGYGMPAFCIQMPVQIKCVNGDTLTINHECNVDMGMAWDIVLMHPSKEEVEFFDNKKEDAVWTEYLDGCSRYYTVSATVFDNFTIDSLRIYTFDNPHRVQSDCLIGQNFLKRFNVFFDIKNQ